MGKGTTALDKAPAKRKLYGDNEFHLRPIYKDTDKLGREIYYFALRPSSNPDYLLEIEGEFGMGKSSLSFERTEVRKGAYKHIKYVYYQFDLEDASPKQKEIILDWAEDGAL